MVELIRMGNALDLEGFPISAASRAGDVIYTAGILPLDSATGEVVFGDIEVRARRTLENLRLVLEAAGSSLGRVAMVHVFLADAAGDLEGFNAVYQEFFSTHHPPRYAVGARLAWPSLKVEMQAVAGVG
jgi:2-iminobutanoate/2-iminopropanoate deaminase